MSEKLFTVVGTALNANGTAKVRWANDLVARIKILDKAGCTKIDLRETPEPMTKLDALEWYSKQENIDEVFSVVILDKLAEKAKATRRAEAKVTITGKIDEAVITNKETDPRVKAFVEKTLAKAEA